MKTANPHFEQHTASYGTHWVPSICNFCSTVCNIKVGVKETKQGKRAVKIEGNPDSPLNRGKTCARGQAGVNQTYDPDRLKKPLIRIEGSKRGEWKFKEATWDEAFQFIQEKMNQYDIKPYEQALIGGWSACVFYMPISVSMAVGQGIPNISASPMQHCVASGHLGTDMVTGNFNIHDEVLVDFENAKYMIFSIANSGIAGISTSRAVRFAEGKKRGAKIVVLDPRRSELAAKADEWLPIKPGTDMAFFLAVMHVLIKKDLYDRDFITRHTNLPHLGFEKDGMIMPMMEPDEKGMPKVLYVYDETSDQIRKVPGFSNTNMFDKDGNKITPSLYTPKDLNMNGMKVSSFFSLLKKQLEQYTPEWAEEETGIPAEDIERIATELGMTRPALIDPGWHGSRYTNIIQTRRAQAMVQVLLGGIDKKGGWIFSAEYREKVKGFWEDQAVGIETPLFRKPGMFFPLTAGDFFFNPDFWPDKHPSLSFAYSMQQKMEGESGVLFPAYTEYGFQEAVEGKVFWNGEPYQLKAFTLNAANPVKHFFPKDRWKDILTNDNVKLVTVIDVLPSETTKYADVILPNSTYIERDEPFLFAAGPAQDLTLTTRFKAVDPKYDTKDVPDILLELARRRGTLKNVIDTMAMLSGVDQERLQEEVNRAMTGEISYTQALRTVFIEHHAKILGKTPEKLEIELLEKGVLVLETADHLMAHANIPRQLPVPTPSGRLEFYSLYLAGFVQQAGYKLNWEPFVRYMPPNIHKHLEKDEFYFVYGKVPTVSYASTNANNLLLMNLSKKKENRHINTWMHSSRAKRLGIKEGEIVEIKNIKTDLTTKAKIHLTELIRPDTIYISSAFGSDPEGMLSVAGGIGTNLGDLVPYDVEPMVTGYRSQEFVVSVKKQGR